MKAIDVLIRVCVVALLSITPACAWGDRTEVELSGSGWRLLVDKDASWEHDSLFLPPVDLSKLPTNPPTRGWASLTDETGIPVSVPGTAEEYLGDGSGPSTDVKGVTWWYRHVEVPANKHQRSTLHFESARQRAEIYVDGKLVGYDIIGNTPFEVDLTSLGLACKTVQLAVRITDPGGNFDWIDYYPQLGWGKYRLPMSHGFGEITGQVKLHMRPFDDRPYYVGWQDSHRAMGPETWLQSDYSNPTRHVGYETDAAEIVYRGEESAISSPPRLEKIHADLRKLSRPGWDGAVYETWYDDFAAFLAGKE